MQIIYTELKDTLEYTCDINVFNVSMIMRVSYNSRSKKRLISLTSLDGSILYLKPTYITYGSRIFPNFNAIIDGLSFYITLDRLTLTGDNYLNWANQFRLCFVEYIPFEKGEGWYLAENSIEENALTPDFGDWIIKPDGINVTGDTILYQASKTNSILTYDSFALSNLQDVLVKSFLDPDLQQWQAVMDAIGQLTGATEWTFDNDNKVVRYREHQEIEGYGILDPITNQPTNSTIAQICTIIIVSEYPNSVNLRNAQYSSYTLSGQRAYCDVSLEIFDGYDWNLTTTQASTSINLYPQTATSELTITYQQVATRIIINSNVADQGISLFAQAYIDEIANSINNTNESKQFVKMEDLVDQFEENKTLRS